MAGRSSPVSGGNGAGRVTDTSGVTFASDSPCGAALAQKANRDATEQKTKQVVSFGTLPGRQSPSSSDRSNGPSPLPIYNPLPLPADDESPTPEDFFNSLDDPRDAFRKAGFKFSEEEWTAIRIAGQLESYAALETSTKNLAAAEIALRHRDLELFKQTVPHVTMEAFQLLKADIQGFWEFIQSIDPGNDGRESE
ncbi:MAG TPA: hypothetical protein VLE89_05890 [Chlamydiales bacterium]|nr:hypothetical protein [Chlamydiales bacterium]